LGFGHWKFVSTEAEAEVEAEVEAEIEV